MENFREKRLERQLKSQQSTSIIIGVILLLSILGNVFLFVRNGTINNEKEELIIENDALLTDKQMVEEKNTQLQADIQELNEQINVVRESAAALQAEIQARDSRIARLRNQVAEIEQLRIQVAELELLKEEFREIEQERQNLLTELQDLGEKLSKLKEQNDSLTGKIDDAANLKAYNICVHNFRDRWLGRPVEMEVARRVNRTMVSFEINGNILVEPEQKDIHLLMIDPGGNVVNPSVETFTIAETGRTSNFTEYTSIQFNRRPVPLNFTITHEDKLDSGTFRMEVYIDGVNSGIQEFNLE